MFPQVRLMIKENIKVLIQQLPSLKLTASLHLKIDDSKTIVSFWGPAYFQWFLLLASGKI